MSFSFHFKEGWTLTESIWGTYITHKYFFLISPIGFILILVGFIGDTQTKKSLMNKRSNKGFK